MCPRPVRVLPAAPPACQVKIVKQQQAEAFSAAASGSNNAARLDFLMRQAELFAHFMQSATAPEKKKRGRKSTKPPAELAAAAAEVVAAVHAGAGGGGSGACLGVGRAGREGAGGGVATAL
jgi:hypothetical protein